MFIEDKNQLSKNLVWYKILFPDVIFYVINFTYDQIIT